MGYLRRNRIILGLFDYVYYTNKLEGNKLTSAQTNQLLSSDSISGENIKPNDKD